MQANALRTGSSCLGVRHIKSFQLQLSSEVISVCFHHSKDHADREAETLGSAGTRKMQNLSTRPRDVSHDRPFVGFCAAVERVNLSKLGQQSNQDSDVLGLGQQVTRTSI